MRNIQKIAALTLVIAITLAIPSFAYAEEGKAEKYIGRIEKIDKDKKEITIRENDVPRVVVYDQDTTFLHQQGKVSSLDAFSRRDRVLVSGTLDAQGRLVAAQMSLRTR